MQSTLLSKPTINTLNQTTRNKQTSTIIKTSKSNHQKPINKTTNITKQNKQLNTIQTSKNSIKHQQQKSPTATQSKPQKL